MCWRCRSPRRWLVHQWAPWPESASPSTFSQYPNQVPVRWQRSEYSGWSSAHGDGTASTVGAELTLEQTAHHWFLTKIAKIRCCARPHSLRAREANRRVKSAQIICEVGITLY